MIKFTGNKIRDGKIFEYGDNQGHIKQTKGHIIVTEKSDKTIFQRVKEWLAERLT